MLTVSLHGQYEITSVLSDISVVVKDYRANHAGHQYSWLRTSTLINFLMSSVRLKADVSKISNLFFFPLRFVYSQATFAYRSDPGRNLASVNWLLTECNNLRGHLLGSPSGIWTIPNTIVFEVINRGQC